MRKLALMLMKNLSDKARNKAIQIENATLRVGKLKIAIAISKAKETIVAYNEKRLNNVKIYYTDI